MQQPTQLPAEAAPLQPYRGIRVWLLIGLVMVLMQVLIGGITRLTDSGLSITEWEVVKGTLPPLNAEQWAEAFELYKVEARKQFETLHADMTLSEFKWIYFWEYFHRLWARSMGLVFIFPFLFFLWKRRGFRDETLSEAERTRRARWMPPWLLRSLLLVIVLAAAEATMGWVMVASGLNEDNRTWVSAYKLIAHLGIATVLFGYLYYTWLRTRQPRTADGRLPKMYRYAWFLLALLGFQILFGGLMAGMRAGLLHPSWPFFVEGERLYNALGHTHLSADDLVNYEASISVKAWVHLIHRLLAWVLAVLLIGFAVNVRKVARSPQLRSGAIWLGGLLLLQFSLGVMTVVNSIGSIPLGYGAAHQVVALLLLISLIYCIYQLRPVGWPGVVNP